MKIIKIEKIQTNEPVYSGNYARGLLKKLGKANKKQEDINSWSVMVGDLSENAVKLGIPASEVKMLVEDIQNLANYSFNKSHALAYSMMAAWTLYLNVYFSKYYYPAVIEYAFAHDKETLETLKDMRRNGFNIHSPNINTSKSRTFSSDRDIFIGLHNLKQVGNAADGICERSGYSSFRDFISKNIMDSKVNKRVVNALVEFGCFDELEPNLTRSQMIRCFSRFWENKPAFKRVNKEDIEKLRSDTEALQSVIKALDAKKNSILNFWDEIKLAAEANPYATKDSREFLKECEEKYLGFNFFVTPFDGEVATLINSKIAAGRCIDDFDALKQHMNISKVVPVFISSVRNHIDKNGNTMAFVTIEDRSGNETSMPIFASSYQYLENKLQKGVIAFMLLYYTKDEFKNAEQIMLGAKKWISPEKYASFVIPIKQEL